MCVCVCECVCECVCVCARLCMCEPATCALAKVWKQAKVYVVRASGDLCAGEQEVLAGYKLKLTCESHDELLDPEHTMMQSGVRGGATLTLKMHGLLGGGGGQTKLSRAGAGAGASAGAGGGAQAAQVPTTQVPAVRVDARNRALTEENAALARENTELKARLAAAAAATTSTVSDSPARPEEAQPAPGLAALRDSKPDQDIEGFIRSLKLEREIAALFPAGTTLEDVVKMEPAQTADVLRQAMPLLQQTLVCAQAKARRVQEAQAAGGAKFGGVLKGGPYEAFLDGVTGIVGEPDADLEAGMRREHTELTDSDARFSTGNYGLTTSPKCEYELVEVGGSGLVRKKVDGSEEERVLVTGTRGAFKGGQESEDLRVLRPVEYYGNFADDGCLIDPAPNDADTPIQRTVKQAGLRRVEVKAVILYTGPAFTLYNSILRGFGACGEVAAGVEFGSEEFWKQLKEVSIEEWVKKSGHRFTNTIHALASAIKKLQRLSQDAQGTLLWRGLDGLDVAEFLAGCGFTDRAFMSTSKDRRTAMEYSGVSKGLVGTVLCIETSTTNNGAEITAFSQYPGEKETVWGACRLGRACVTSGPLLRRCFAPNMPTCPQNNVRA